MRACRLSFFLRANSLHLHLPTYVYFHNSISFTHARFHKRELASILDSNAQNQRLSARRALNTMDLTDTLDPTVYETLATDDSKTTGGGDDDNKEVNGMIHKEENKFQKAIASWRSMPMAYPTIRSKMLKE